MVADIQVKRLQAGASVHHFFATPEFRRMRYFFGLIFLVFLGAIGVFAVQNTQAITVKFWSWSVTAPVAILSIAAYVLGMMSGWNVVAFMRSSIRSVSAPVQKE